MHIFKYYIQLLKFRLSFTVVFSAVAGYLLGLEKFVLEDFLLLTTGGFLITGSANGFNQILEREYDGLMKRTLKRPLPSKNLSVSDALIFSSIIGLIGLYLLNQIHPEGTFFGFFSKSCVFGFLAMLLYVLSYTPLKRLSPISIFVGAIPGAIPFLLGWVAATDHFGLAAGILFAIQFFWQFPHFIAIAWVLDDEYNQAGFKMMIGGKKGKISAFFALITSIIMTIISILPYFSIHDDLKLSTYSFVIILMLGAVFSYFSYLLFRYNDDKQARILMIGSFFYLPLMQIIYVLDKFTS